HQRGILLADAVNGSLDIRLGDLRGRATDAEPTARVDDEQAAVGVFEHIGRMEVLVFTYQKIFRLYAEAGAVALDDMPLDAIAVELCGEEIALILLAEGSRAIAHEARRCD